MPSDVAATTHRNKKLPKVVEHLRMTKGKSGGVVVEHHHTRFEHPPESHVFGSDEGGKLKVHLEKHMGIKLDASDAAAGTEENVGAKEAAQL